MEGVKEGEEVDDQAVEARSPDVTRTMFEEGRPKSERAELALAAPALPSAENEGAESRSTVKEKEKDKQTRRRSKSSTPNEWVFVSVDKGKGGSETSGSPPLDEAPPARVESPPALETARKGSFKRWFGGGGETKKKAGKPKTKAQRRRGGMAQALRSSRRLTIE